MFSYLFWIGLVASLCFVDSSKYSPKPAKPNVQIVPIPQFVPYNTDFLRPPDKPVLLLEPDDGLIGSFFRRYFPILIIILLLGSVVRPMPAMVPTPMIPMVTTPMPVTTPSPLTCANNPCQSGGLCQALSNGVFVGCVCPPGLCGTFCECTLIAGVCNCAG